MKNEPVMTAASIVGAIMAIAAFAVAMGWMNWDNAQLTSFEAMLIAVVPLVLTLSGGWYARQQVSPVNKEQ